MCVCVLQERKARKRAQADARAKVPTALLMRLPSTTESVALFLVSVVYCSLLRIASASLLTSNTLMRCDGVVSKHP